MRGLETAVGRIRKFKGQCVGALRLITALLVVFDFASYITTAIIRSGGTIFISAYLLCLLYP
jgi:hypothetical protein